MADNVDLDLFFNLAPISMKIAVTVIYFRKIKTVNFAIHGFVSDRMIRIEFMRLKWYTHIGCKHIYFVIENGSINGRNKCHSETITGTKTLSKNDEAKV